MPEMPDMFAAQQPKAESPLAKYYRLPGLTVGLPTNGAYLPEGSVDFTAEQEVAVLPMRAADEMMMKNPDALMSGNAVEMLFESCVPAIKTPGLISAPDMDVLLLAIRVATYGRTMEVEAVCPKCEAELAFDCNLPAMLQTMKPVPTTAEVRLTNEIVAVMRPYTIRDISTLSRKVYDEERRLQVIENDQTMTDEQKNGMRKALFKRVSEFQSKLLADTITKIVVPEGEVSDNNEIAAFMINTSTLWNRKIEDKQKELNEGGLDKTIAAKCQHCEHEWRTMIEFDPSNFFG